LFGWISSAYIIVPKRGKLKYIRRRFYGILRTLLTSQHVGFIVFPTDFYKIDTDFQERVSFLMESISPDTQVLVVDNHNAIDLGDITNNVYRISRTLFIKSTRIIIC